MNRWSKTLVLDVATRAAVQGTYQVWKSWLARVHNSRTSVKIVGRYGWSMDRSWGTSPGVVHSAFWMGSRDAH